MNKFLLFFSSLILTFSTWSQCNVIATANASQLLCNGDCNGMITYVYQNTNMSSPGMPYVVSIQNTTTGQWLSTNTYTQEIQTLQFTNLCAGVYMITVQGQSCSYTTYATIAQPPAINASVNTTDPSFGASNGSATIIASGGTGALTYSLNGTTYQSSNTFTGLAAGTYTAYVKDANGCVETVSFTLTDPVSCNIAVTAYGGGVLCFGACNAVVQYAYSGNTGSGPFSIELINSSGQTVQVATNASTTGSGAFVNVCAGTYTVEVTNAQGCTGFYTYTVSQPTQLLISNVSTTNATVGNSNGSATVTATGGVPGYTYSLDGTNYQGSNVFNGLAAGVHVAYVKDQNGCVSVFTFVIQETTGCTIVMTSSSIPVMCSGSCSGSIIYTYTMASALPVTVVLESNGNTVQSVTNQQSAGTGTFGNLCAGNYTVTATDANGCSYVNNVIVTQPTQLMLTATSVSPTSGNNNGSITAIASGGTAPYQYALNGASGWQTSNVFTGLGTGVYIVYVLDANGCINLYTVQLQQITGCTLAINGFGSATSCAYSNDGTVNYTYTSSGTGTPFTIQLMQNGNVVQTTTTSNSVGNGIFNNLYGGVYTLTITASNGCVYTTQVFVDSPDQLNVTSVVIDNASAGQSNGSALVTVTGGTAPYQFSLDNGSTWTSNNNLTGLAQGAYIMLVEDANGCQTIYCFIVNEDPGCTLTSTLYQGQPITCYGSCNGSLAYAYTGGGLNAPNTITLSQNGNIVSTTTSNLGAYQGVFTGLCAGNYSLTVTDATGCSSNVSNYTLTQPAQLTVTNVAVTNATSGSSNGSAVITASGGTGQYQYSLNGTTWQSSNTFTGLAAGIYIAYIIDANNCTAIYTFQVQTNSSCTLVLTAYTTSGNLCAGSCDADLAFAFTESTANPPYNVYLSGGNGVTANQTFTTGANGQGSFNNLCAGTYTVTVQDAVGCSATYTVVISSPQQMAISTSQTNPTAGNSDGSFTINVTGGTPQYQYSTDNMTTWVSTNTWSNMPAGLYIIYVRDQNGCMQIVCVLLGSPTADVIELNNEVSVYPNPTNGLVFVQSNNIEELTLFSMSGQILSAPTIDVVNGKTLDLSGFAKGIYSLQITNKNGSLNRVQIVKE